MRAIPKMSNGHIAIVAKDTKIDMIRDPVLDYPVIERNSNSLVSFGFPVGVSISVYMIYAKKFQGLFSAAGALTAKMFYSVYFSIGIIAFSYYPCSLRVLFLPYSCKFRGFLRAFATNFFAWHGLSFTSLALHTNPYDNTDCVGNYTAWEDACQKI